MAAVFVFAHAAGVHLILTALFGFLDRAAPASAHFATGIAAVVFAITVVYVVGALSLYLVTAVQARRWAVAGALILLGAGQLLAFGVIFLGLLQQHADDGR